MTNKVKDMWIPFEGMDKVDHCAYHTGIVD